MKREVDLIPLSELETAVEGLVPEMGAATKVMYVLAMVLLASLIISVVIVCSYTAGA